MNAAQCAASRFAHHGFDCALVALHILFEVGKQADSVLHLMHLARLFFHIRLDGFRFFGAAFKAHGIAVHGILHTFYGFQTVVELGLRFFFVCLILRICILPSAQLRVNRRDAGADFLYGRIGSLGGHAVIRYGDGQRRHLARERRRFLGIPRGVGKCAFLLCGKCRKLCLQSFALRRACRRILLCLGNALVKVLFRFIFGKLVLFKAFYRFFVMLNGVFLYADLCVQRRRLFLMLCGNVADFFDLHVDSLRILGGFIDFFTDDFQFLRRRLVSRFGSGDFMLLLAQAVVGAVNRIEPRADFELFFFLGKH